MQLVKLKSVHELREIFFEKGLSNPVERAINLADKVVAVISDYSNILIIKTDKYDDYITITSDCIEYKLPRANANITDLGQNAVPHNNS